MIDTALHHAASSVTEHCDHDVIDLLIKQGINVNHLNHPAMTALNYAIERGRVDVFKALLDAGANVFPTETRTTVSTAQKPTAPLCQLLDSTGQGCSTSAQGIMFAELIKRGANPNILTTKDIPAFMVALGFGSDRIFEPHIAKIFLSSPKLDLGTRCPPSRVLPSMTALDCTHFYSPDGSNKAQGTLVLKDHIREKFAKRLVSVEKEILDSVKKFPVVIASLISQYECADDKFEQYGFIPSSMTFLYNITEDERFKVKVVEQRKLLSAPKSASASA